MSQVSHVGEVLRPSLVSFGRGARRGCGLVVAQDRVLGFAHHLRAERVEVRRDGASASAGELRAIDRATGLAMIDVQTGDAPAVRWAEALPDLGATVFAISDPGGTGLRVTEGRVSAEPLTIRWRGGRRLQVIEHTAPLPRGSGGGPLVDDEGTVLGLNALAGDPGFLLALPAAAAHAATERLLAGRHEPRRIGVALAPPRAARRMREAVGLPPRDGLLVRAVEEGTPAHRAGIAVGDLIVRLGQTDIKGIDDLFDALDAREGDTLEVLIVRGVDEHTLTLHFDGGDQ